MTKEEKILFEQYVTFRMMDFTKGIEYLNLLFNMRDFSNPKFKNEYYLGNELVFIDMHPDESGIYFSGAMSISTEEEHENRSITGWFYEEKGKTIIEMNVFRHGIKEGDETREYSVLEMFTPNKDGDTYKRFTSYKSALGIENHLSNKYKLNDEFLKEFIHSKTTEIKIK